MDTIHIDELLNRIKHTQEHPVANSELTPPMILRCQANEPVPWNEDDIESAIHGVIPGELKAFWSKVAEIRLNDDVNYGQWGCIIWSPAEVIARHKEALRFREPDDFRVGDLIVGEFRGDNDLLLLRCDPSENDFGAIIVALPMDTRQDWPRVASSIIEFVEQFLAHPEKKYWEVVG